MTMRYIRFLISLALVLSLFSRNAAAEDFKEMSRSFLNGSRVGFSIEWGYTGTFIHKYHNDYVDSTDGYRIDVRDTDYLLYSNAFMQAGVSFETAEHYALALNFGFDGVFQERRMFPVTLRFSYFFRSLHEDGIFAMAEAGKAFVFDGNDIENNIARLGGGYRISLSSKHSMDVKSFFQICTDHPDIYNMNLGQKVQPIYVNCSDSFYGALVFSVALNF